MLNDGISVGNSEVVSTLLASGQDLPRPFRQHLPVPVSGMPRHGSHACDPRGADVQDSSTGRIKMNNFDLNDIYIDSDDGTKDIERPPAPVNSRTSSLDFPSWVHQDSQHSSPPQTSGNSDSASAQSPSSTSSGYAQVKYAIDRVCSLYLACISLHRVAQL